MAVAVPHHISMFLRLCTQDKRREQQDEICRCGSTSGKGRMDHDPDTGNVIQGSPGTFRVLPEPQRSLGLLMVAGVKSSALHRAGELSCPTLLSQHQALLLAQGSSPEGCPLLSPLGSTFP